MKINGFEIQGPNRVLLVLPRGDQMIPFEAEAIMSFEEFDKLCPLPKPPVKLTPKGRVEDVDNADFKQAIDNYNDRRMSWMVLNSLKPTQIEWSKVNMDKPSTWKLWQDEMKEAGFTDVEIGRVIRLVMEANCLDEAKLDWAREVFVRGQQEAVEQSQSQATEQDSSESGEPAPASE